jgi:hypothetical protein
MQLLIGQALGLLAGTVACWIFWRWLLLKKPDVRLASELALNPETGRLGVKIANFGKRQANNAEIRIASVRRTSEGRLITLTDARLRASSVLALDPKDNMDVPWCLPTTYIFVCQNGADLCRDISAVKDGEERRIVVTLSVRDAISGTLVLTRQSYGLQAIRRGWYQRGLTFRIVPNENPPADIEQPGPSDIVASTSSGDTDATVRQERL